MPILFHCACGKALRVADENAGKRVRCPGCEAVLTVPASERKAEPPSGIRKPVAPPSPPTPPAPPARKASDALAKLPKPAAAKPSPPIPPDRPRPTARPKANVDDVPDELIVDDDEGPNASDTPEVEFWAFEGGYENLVAVTNFAVCYGNFSESDHKRLMAALKRGGDPEQLITEYGGTVIPYDTMYHLYFNKHTRSLEFKYRPKGVLSQDKDGNIYFGNKELRGEVFESINARLPDWNRTVEAYGVGKAMLAPLGTTLVLAFMTWAFYMAAKQVASGKGGDASGLKEQIAEFIVGTLGPVGVGLIGGLLVACGLAWLAMRVRTPPVFVTLKPTAMVKSKGARRSA